MPFVRIDALHADKTRLDGLGRAVHESLVDALGIPADDLFQVLTSHDGTTGMFRYDRDYLGVHRDDGIWPPSPSPRPATSVAAGRRRTVARSVVVAAGRAVAPPPSSLLAGELVVRRRRGADAWW